MKLKIYNKANSATLRKGKPTVRVNSKSGAISFNTFATMELGLVTDTGLEIVQDENRPQDWYIMKSDSDSAFKARPKALTRDGFIIQSVVLSKAILKSVNADSTSASFLIGTVPVVHDGVELYAIITKSMNAR